MKQKFRKLQNSNHKTTKIESKKFNGKILTLSRKKYDA